MLTPKCKLLIRDKKMLSQEHRLVTSIAGRTFSLPKTLKDMESMRKQFFFLLKEASLIDNTEGCSKLSYNDHIVHAIFCAALFPGICSVDVSCCHFFIYFTFPLAIVSTH